MHPTKHIKEGDVLIAKEDKFKPAGKFTATKEYVVGKKSSRGFYLISDQGNPAIFSKEELMVYFASSPSEELELPTDEEIDRMADRWVAFTGWMTADERSYKVGFKAALELIKSQYNLIKK